VNYRHGPDGPALVTSCRQEWQSVTGVPTDLPLQPGIGGHRRLLGSGMCSALWFVFIIGGATAALIRRVAVYGVDVPMSDQWVFIPTLSKLQGGTLGLSDLAAPHNEHRILFPRLIMVGLANITGWNVRAEMLVSVLLMGATAFVITMALWVRGLRRVASISVAAIACFCLLPSQAENVLWGWQLQIPLAVCGCAVAIFFVDRQPIAVFVLSLVAAIIAQWSFGTGVLAWPLAAIALLGHQDTVWPQRRRRLIMLSASAIFSTGLYLRGLPGGSLGELFRHPVRSSSHALIQIGMPLVGRAECTGDLTQGCRSTAVRARTVSVLLIAVFALLTVVAARRRPRRSEWLPVTCFGLLGIASALIISAGRSSFGGTSAMQGRYQTLVLPLWVAAAVLGVMAFVREQPGAAGVARRRTATTRIATGLVFVLAGTMFVAQGSRWDSWYRGRRDGVARFRALVLSPSPTDEQLSGGFIASIIREQLPAARELRWSAWRGQP
jgi:hypothetical protein